MYFYGLERTHTHSRSVSEGRYTASPRDFRLIDNIRNNGELMFAGQRCFVLSRC